MSPLPTSLLVAAFSMAAPQEDLHTAENPILWLTIRQYPEYPAPGLSFRFPPGLVLVILSDGTFFRAIGQQHVGSRMARGRIDTKAMEDVVRQFDRVWFDRLRYSCEGVVLDAASQEVAVTVAGERLHARCSLDVGNDSIEELNRWAWSLKIDSANSVDQEEVMRIVGRFRGKNEN